MTPQEFPNSAGCKFPIRIANAQLTDWMQLGDLEIESTALVGSGLHRDGAVSIQLDSGTYHVELKGVALGDVRRLGSIRLRRRDCKEPTRGDDVANITTHGCGYIAVFPNEKLTRELAKHDHDDFFDDPLWTCRLRSIEELDSLPVAEAMLGLHADGHVPISELTNKHGHRVGIQLDFIVSCPHAD